MESTIQNELVRAARATGKAEVSEPGLLQTALLMCQLSAAVYDPDELELWDSEQLRQALSAINQHIASAKPELVDSSKPITGGPLEDLGRQYGIWKVEGLGVVVAFSGTQDAQDMLADLEFDTWQLKAGPHTVHLHKGFYKAVKLSCDEIARQCVKLCRGTVGEVLPLFLTGKPAYSSLDYCRRACALDSIVLSIKV